MRNLKVANNIYPVGVTGEFNKEKDYLYSLGKIQVKLIQIMKYCRKYNKEVVLFLDENTPFEFYHYFYSQGLTIRPVLKEIGNSDSLHIVHTDDIKQFLDETCEVIFVVCTKEDKELFDFEKPTKYYLLKDKINNKKIITKDPNETLKKVIQKIKPKSDPYGIFFHELLYQKQPLTYYAEVMDTMPDINTLNDRSF